MILILVSIVAAMVMAIVLFKYGDNGYEGMHFVSQLCGLLLGVAACISAVAYSFVCFNWLSAEYQANIINREYGTNYTQEEVFYAHNVIDTIRQLERHRYEINGDIGKSITKK